MKRKTLVLCHDTVGEKMAGPGIRYQNLANQIQKVSDVTLAVYSDSDKPTKSGVTQVSTTSESYKSLFDQHDIIFAQWLSGDMLTYANETGKTIIIDLYAPVPIEYLASLGFSDKKLDDQNDIEFAGILETYKQYLTLGDFFVCSNERQRDFWVGFMTSSNIIRPTNFTVQAKMERLALCPMGIPSTAPPKKDLKLRQAVGASKDDFVMLWTGGIWDWFDAQSIVKALKLVGNPKVKLVFMGTQHPNTKVSEMSESKATRKLASDLGLINKTVFFLDGWVDYDDRASYLLDADVAIYADKDSVETRFSHRTRVLDHIWVGLPTICSKGDYLSDVIEQKGMGIVVGDRTPEGFAKAIVEAHNNPKRLIEIRSNISEERRAFTWDELSADLLDFIQHNKPKQPPTIDGSTVLPPSITYSKKAMRRVKNSIKVLIGRADVR